jgi:hypothetical protein
MYMQTHGYVHVWGILAFVYTSVFMSTCLRQLCSNYSNENVCTVHIMYYLYQTFVENRK